MTRLTMGSLFAGIGGFELGFERAGFETRWQVEWDRHASAVLARHWPDVARYGDIQDVSGHELEPVDVITFGSPCQDLSVAGKRAGLDGERSSMFFEALRVFREMREATNGGSPTLVVWENVPGAFSSNGGRDFAYVLAGLAELGAVDIAWRVLDAQFFGVAQRRRRVFVIADFGGERAAEILFERESVRRHPPARRAAGQGTTRDIAPSLAASGRGVARAGDSRGQDPLVVATANTLQTDEVHAVVADTLTVGANQTTGFVGEAVVASTITANTGNTYDHAGNNCAPHNLIVESVSLRGREGGAQVESGGDVSPALRSGDGGASRGGFVFTSPHSVAPTVTAKWANGSGGPAGDEAQNLVPVHIPDKIGTLAGGAHPGGLNGQEAETQSLALPGGVRRLTPRECERLQGFPDDWTSGQADAQRYRQLGNAVAVPVAEWIGRRALEVLEGE